MRIPIIVTDLSELANGVATRRFTFRQEDAARRHLVALKADAASGQLELPAGTDLILAPRETDLTADSFEAATAGGYTINFVALQAVWAQAEPAVQALAEAQAAPLAEEPAP